MTTAEKVIRHKLSMLELAKELKNVSKASRIIGYSRQQFYEIKRNYQIYGIEGIEHRTTKVGGRKVMGLSNASTKLFWMNIFESWAGKSSMKLSKRCKRTWIFSCLSIIRNGRIRSET